MTQYLDLAVNLKGSPGNELKETASVEMWPFTKRFARGGKLLLCFWCLAACALLIPGLHFILTPALLVGGLCGFVLRARQKGIFLSSKLRCPNCQNGFNLEGELFLLPRYVLCEHCSQQVYLESAASLAEQK